MNIGNKYKIDSLNIPLWIEGEHHRAERLRLVAGYAGCGCSLCQQFYSSLELNKYGDRVKKQDNFISIEAGKTGADLWDEYHKLDHWIMGDQVFVTGGKGYGVTPMGRTVCLGDEKDILAGVSTYKQSVTGASKVKSGSRLPKQKKECLK